MRNTFSSIVQLQNSSLSKIKDIRISNGVHEFRICYRGGFGYYIAIDYRKNGTKNRWKYFGGVGAYHCVLATDAINLCIDEINKKYPLNPISKI